MRSALAWKRLYEEERRAMGTRGLDELLDRAETIDAPRDAAAWIFPHARATECGHLVAAVASRLVRARVDRVLAIGVLHGAREQDAASVTRARAGDEAARASLRGVHRGDGLAAEEFSLDLFAVLLARAALRAGTAPPEIVARYPFLVGVEVANLPGLAELSSLHDAGCAIIATTDPMHHGAGYGTPPHDRRPRDATTFARAAIEAQLDALTRGDLAAFLREAEDVRSDFRDVGPVLATLLGARPYAIDDIVLVDYTEILGAPPPTWVAAALVHAA